MRRPADWHGAWIGLGSNLGNRAETLRAALGSLDSHAECRVEAVSPVYQSRAIGPGEQPDYLNAAARLGTGLEPASLLRLLLDIELDNGRQRQLHWGPRTLDLDLLLYESRVCTDATLTLPHPRLHERNFVLFPLADLDPDLQLPDGRRIDSLRDDLGNNGLERLSGFRF